MKRFVPHFIFVFVSASASLHHLHRVIVIVLRARTRPRRRRSVTHSCRLVSSRRRRRRRRPRRRRTVVRRSRAPISKPSSSSNSTSPPEQRASSLALVPVDPDRAREATTTMSTRRPSPVAESRVASVRGDVPVRARAGCGLTHTSSSHEPPIHQYMHAFHSFIHSFVRYSETVRTTESDRPFDRPFDRSTVRRENQSSIGDARDRSRRRAGSVLFGSVRFFSVHQFVSH